MTSRSGATVDVLEALGLDPDVDGPLIEWQDPDPDDPDTWVTHAARSSGLVTYATQYGRSDARSKVAPAQVTVKAAPARAGAAPQIGDPFRITLCAAAAAALDLDEDEAARFTGEVTDVQLDPAGRVWTIVGVGSLAREARTAVDLTLAGTQTAGDRVTAILTGLGVTSLGDVDDSDLELVAPDTAATGTSLLDGVADATLAQTIQDLDGLVSWHTPESRRGLTAAITLDASEVLAAITWAKHIGSVVNIATINYAGGSITVTDHASLEARGAYPVTITTALETAGDARSLGVLIVGRFGTPEWDLPTLPVDVARSVDPDKLPALLRLRFGRRLALTSLPADGPIVGDFDFYLEGFVETAARYSWRLGLAVSDPALSGVSLRWIDLLAPTFAPVTVDAGTSAAAGPYPLTIDGGNATATSDAELEWQDVYPAVRWLDVAAMENAADLGPYDDRNYDGGLAA